MDNTSDKYVLPWLEAVKEISPRQVMIYTIDRETPDHDLQKATHEESSAATADIFPSVKIAMSASAIINSNLAKLFDCVTSAKRNIIYRHLVQNVTSTT